MAIFGKPRASAGRAGIVAAGAVVLALSVGVLPASAALQEGRGAFTAVAAPTYEPFLGVGSENPCSVYTGYNANLTFANGTVGSYEGPINADVRSDADVRWAENPDGTWNSTSVPPYCPPQFDPPPDTDPATNDHPPTDKISPFSGVLTGANATGETLACRVTGTYQRGFESSLGHNPQLNVRYDLTNLSGDCGGLGSTDTITIKATIPSVAAVDGPFGNPSACVSPIAPPACVLGPYQG